MASHFVMLKLVNILLSIKENVVLPVKSIADSSLVRVSMAQDALFANVSKAVRRMYVSVDTFVWPVIASSRSSPEFVGRRRSRPFEVFSSPVDCMRCKRRGTLAKFISVEV